MGEPSRVRVTGPLEPFAAGFIFELQESGYRPAAAAVQVRVLAHLSRWMQEQRVSAEALREPELERLRCEHLVRVASVRGAGMTVVLGHLRELGVVPAQAPVVVTAADELLGGYRRYLTVERGLTAGTVRSYIDIVRPFVESRVTETGAVELWDLSPADVLGFLLAETRRRSRKSSKLLVSALRVAASVLARPGSDRPSVGWGGAVGRGLAACWFAAGARSRAGPGVVGEL
jgi:hypothetical protein